MYTINDVTNDQYQKWISSRPLAHLERKRKDQNGMILNGIFEDNSYTIPQRYLFIDGVCFQQLSKDWVDSNSSDKPPLAEAPWGSYPEYSMNPKKAAGPKDE